MMQSVRKPSVVPIYTIAAVWLIYTLATGLHRLLDVAICAALSVGQVFYQFFAYALPEGGWTLLVFLLLWGAVGYFVAEMLLQKSFWVFRGGWKGCVALCLVLTAFIAVMELGAPLFMRIFTTAPEEIAAGALNLRIEILGQVFYAVFLIYHSLMTGSGHTWWVFFSSFSNCILFRLILALVFNHLWGITGIYIACAVAPSISIPIGMYYTRLGHWRRSLAD